MSTEFDSVIDWPIAESTALLIRLDSNLAVQNLSGAWRGKLNLAADEALTPPLAVLIN